METNNKEFKKINQIVGLSLLILFIMFLFVKDIYFIYIVTFIMILFIYNDCRKLFQDLFRRIRELISFIESDDEYFMDNDLGIIYDKVEKLKIENSIYKKRIVEEKKCLKKDIEDICHQMKTPLTLLSLYNEMLENDFHQKYLYESSKQIDRMNHLMNSFLKLSKVETIAFQYEQLPIDYVIDLSLRSLTSLIQEKAVNIHHYHQEIMFYYDESWLQEALSNIIKNSIEKGCRNLSITYEKKMQYFKIFISNDGEEILQKDLSHLFDRFYRTQNSLNSGAGIGLSITKEIISRHHGDIVVYNKNGVVFEITFPLYSLSNKYDVTKL